MKPDKGDTKGSKTKGALPLKGKPGASKPPGEKTVGKMSTKATPKKK